MLELKKNTLKLKFENKELEIKFPTPKDLELVGKDENATGFKAFFVALGMPGEIFDELEIQHITTIMENLTAKKN